MRLRMAGLALLSAAFLIPKAPAAVTRQQLAHEVRHQLVMLPYYSVFDDLEFKVDENGHVTLMGEVTRPTLKDDAGRVVQSVDGVQGVTNNIEVLPVSPQDDRIRLEEYRSIYGFTSLNRYAMSAVPSIHIIVKNGNVKLVGVVDNQADKDTAGVRANSVPGVFSVQNDLQVVNNNNREH